MRRTWFLSVTLLALSAGAFADETGHTHSAKTPAAKAPVTNVAATADRAAKPQSDVQMSGMSVLGNDEAPKSLVIVPWKSSQLGNMPGLSKLLDDSIQPVDKDVFLRELAYYRIKTDSK
jgi:hypothetical protein